MASQHGGHSSNTHYRLHLKFIDHRDRTNRDEVFRVTFGILDAPLTRLNTADSGYYVITDDMRTIDKLLTDKATKELAKINLQPAIHPDIKVKRTIFIRQVDMTVGGRTPDEICQLQNLEKIQEVIKIKDYTYIFKLICKDSDTTQRILTNGLLAFNTKINPNQMSIETFTHLLIFCKCYKYKTHATKDCTETQPKCSECA